MMTVSRACTIVSTHWLHGQIAGRVTKTAPRHLRVLDTTYDLERKTDPYKEQYLKSHIPQSLYFDLFHGSESTPEIPVNLPDVTRFSEYGRKLGIWPDTHIVAYDRTDRHSAFRTWWMFRAFGHRNISVLDGGLQKWVRDGYDVTTDIPEVESSNFEAKLDKSLIRSLDDVVDTCKRNAEQIVDARPRDHPTCTDAGTGGVIKGSVHVSYPEMFAEDGTMKPDAELRRLFDGAGVELSRPMMATCMAGITACGVAATAHKLGVDNVPVYYGSWLEFLSKGPSELQTRAVGREE